MSATFAEQWWSFRRAKDEFEETLLKAAGEGFDFTETRTDDYDSSIEIDGAPPSARLNEAIQRLLAEAGFSKAYLNHTDGWETHYSWGAQFEPVPGWGRRRTETGFEITYWPEGWDSPSTKDWLSSGYMKIVDRDAPPSSHASLERIENERNG